MNEQNALAREKGNELMRSVESGQIDGNKKQRKL